VVTTESPARERPAFDTPNILWFFGAFTAAGASAAVISQVHPTARATWILLASLAFLAAFAVLAAALLRNGWWIPGGVLAAMAVIFVGPAAGAFERLIGVWRTGGSLNPIQEFEGPAFALLVAVAVAGLVAFAIVRFPFILVTVVLATFFAAQLLLPVFVKQPSAKEHATAFIVVGAALILVGLAFDLMKDRPSAFWWHLVGLTALSIGFGYHAFQHSTWGWVLILVVGCFILLGATFLVRGTWAVFGVAGFYAPIAHYLNDWFGNLGTAFALAALGILLVAMGLAARRFGGTWPALPRRAAAPA
jgi:hypothetical protein